MNPKRPYTDWRGVKNRHSSPYIGCCLASKDKERIVLTKNMTMMRMYLVNQRQALGLSMLQTSSILDLDFHHYYRIEMGQIKRVSFLILCRIARVLEISLDDLYKLETTYQAEEQ